MSNSRYDANSNLLALTSSLENHIPPKSKLHWDIHDQDFLYNTDQATLIQLLELSMQKEHEFRVVYWDWLWNAASAPPWFQKAFQKLLLNSSEKNFLNDTDLETQFQAVKRTIEDGFLPILVAHSQGNLFVNSIYRLTENKVKNRLAISAVATPASRVEGGGPYVTLDSDGVIKYLASAFEPKPLPANSTNRSPRPGRFDHAFIEHYLKGEPTGAKVIENTVSQMKKLADLHAENTRTEPDPECVSWFNEGKAIHESNFFDCFDQCPIGITGMADFFCPMQCDRLCGCESYPWQPTAE
jgi:hypothetical protein